jgi:hypothetical protein
MAWKDIVGSALSFVEKILKDASLWFWIGIATLVLVVADARGFIQLRSALAEPQVGLRIALVIVTCLWLNALQLHHFLGLGVSRLRNFIANKFDLWDRRRRAGHVVSGAEKTLRDLLNTRCLERRWFLWYVSVLRKEPNTLLPYASIKYDEEFAGARGLFALGLLHRTGDTDSSLVFIHKKISEAYESALANHHSISSEVRNEYQEIESKGRAALKDKLPLFASEKFFKRH